MRFIRVGKDIIKQYACSQKELVDIKITFVTDLGSQSYEHYLQQPRQMVERNICNLLDYNRSLIKTINKMPGLYRPYR